MCAAKRLPPAHEGRETHIRGDVDMNKTDTIGFPALRREGALSARWVVATDGRLVLEWTARSEHEQPVRSRAA
jgi:hypothetical protein